MSSNYANGTFYDVTFHNSLIRIKKLKEYFIYDIYIKKGFTGNSKVLFREWSIRTTEKASWVSMKKKTSSKSTSFNSQL